MLRTAVAVSLLAVSFSFGCRLARMQPDPKLAAKAQPMVVDVQGSLFEDTMVVFGPYRATNIQKSWRTSTTKSSGGPASDTSSNQTWSFNIESQNGPALRVTCTWYASSTNVNLGGGSSISSGQQTVVCQTGENTDLGQLALTWQGGHWSGTVKHMDVAFDLASKHELEGGGSMGTPAGYEMRGPDGAVAAVSVVNGRTAWIDPSLSPRAQSVAAAFVVSVHYLEKARER